MLPNGNSPVFLGLNIRFTNSLFFFSGLERGKAELMRRVNDPSYFKFMVARHPFYRLTSGWNEKFSTNKSDFHLSYWRRNHGDEIKKEFGAKFPPIDDHTVSFNAFLSYLARKNDKKTFEWEC